MAVVKPFICIRPAKENAAKVAALPYDVYNRKEACAAVAGNPISFLNIDRAETQFSDDVDTYADCVYEKARELLDTQIAEGVYVTDAGDHYYLYELTMDGRSQTGIVACSSIDDYVNGVVKKHENTREDKELDRIRHVDTVNAQTGPIFLAYRQNETLKAIVAEEKANRLSMILYLMTASATECGRSMIRHRQKPLRRHLRQFRLPILQTDTTEQLPL